MKTMACASAMKGRAPWRSVGLEKMRLVMIWVMKLSNVNRPTCSNVMPNSAMKVTYKSGERLHAMARMKLPR